MQDFETTIAAFRTGKLQVDEWNFCIGRAGYWAKDANKKLYFVGGTFAAYIMGEGAEQCLASKHGFVTEQEIRDLYNSLGVKRILPI